MTSHFSLISEVAFAQANQPQYYNSTHCSAIAHQHITQIWFEAHTCTSAMRHFATEEPAVHLTHTTNGDTQFHNVGY